MKTLEQAKALTVIAEALRADDERWIREMYSRYDRKMPKETIPDVRNYSEKADAVFTALRANGFL